MRSVTVHPHAHVPVPAGSITRVTRHLIGGTHSSPALADQSRFSKGEIKYSRKPLGAADFSKPQAAKFNPCNADMCGNAASSSRTIYKYLWKIFPFSVLSSFIPQLFTYRSCFFLASLRNRFRGFSKRKYRANREITNQFYDRLRGRGDFNQTVPFPEIYSQICVPATSPLRPHVPSSVPTRPRLAREQGAVCGAIYLDFW